MRIVVKLGTRLVTKADGTLDKENILRLVGELGELLDKSVELIIVSSGAIGAGCGRFGCLPASLSIVEKQAIASVGQTDLINIYREAFSSQGRMVGQMLLTVNDLTERTAYLNVKNTLGALLKMGVVPVINENDSVAVEEIKFGDNDLLSAFIAAKVDADKLIVMTDVDGLLDEAGNVVKEIETVDDTIREVAKGRGSDYSVGGMATKVKAAETVMRMCGADTYIANGRTPGVLAEIFRGGNPGTRFISRECGVSHKKRWIYGISPSGNVVLDGGAVEAIREKNRSLLPVGIVSVTGEFKQGDSVSCIDGAGAEVARGLVNYDSKDLRRIIGRNSSDIETILGFKYYDEVINRDNMIVMS